MEEQGSEIEKIAQADELKLDIGEARSQIERDMKDPVQRTADAAGEVGLVQELWRVMQKNQPKANELVWKDVKATAAGLLSVIPLVGEAGTIAKFGAAAGKGKAALSAERTAWSVRKGLGGEKVLAGLARDRTRGQFWTALKDVPRNPVHLVTDPLKSGKEAWGARQSLKGLEKSTVVVPGVREGGDFIAQANKTVLEGIRTGKIADAKTAYSVAKKQFGKDVLIGAGLEVMRQIDPFPDVPPTLAMVAGFAEFVLPGANIIPALWQLGHNKIEATKMYGNMALDMGKVVMRRIDKKFDQAKQPQVAQAAAAFAMPTAG